MTLLLICIVHSISIVKEVSVLKLSAEKTARSLSNFIEETIEINDLIGLNILLNSIKNEHISTLVFHPAEEYEIFPNKIQLGQNVLDSILLHESDFTVKNNGHKIGSFSTYIDIRELSFVLLISNSLLYISLIVFIFLTLIISQHKISSTLIKISKESDKISSESYSIKELKTLYSKMKASKERNSITDIYLSVINNLLSSVEKSLESQKREETSKIRLDLAKKVSHDIRGPIAAIKMSLANEDNTNIVDASLERIENIANDLLDKERVRPKKFVSNIEQSIEQVIQEKRLIHVGIDLVLNAPKQLTPLNINETDFKRVISNLINNSIEASDTDSKIEIDITANDERTVIEVLDFGKGLSLETQEKLNKGISLTSGKDFGNGIGFHSAYETLKSYGASIQINSSKEFGTKVTIIVPNQSMTSRDRIIHIDNDDLIRLTWKSLAKKSNTKIYSFEKVEDIDLSNFTKDDFFYIDNDLGLDRKKGSIFCNELSIQGYKNIYLSTGDDKDLFPNLHSSIKVIGKEFPTSNSTT